MNKESGTFKTLIRRYTLLLPLLTLYVTAFWGFFDTRWPEPIPRFAGCLLRGCMQCYRNHVAVGDNFLLHHRFVWMAVSIVFGGLLPLIVMALFKRRPGDLGLGKPNRWGWRVIWIGLSIVAPLSLVFAWEQLSGQPTPRVEGLPIWGQILVIIGVSIPEHILLTGICVAVFLPGYRLPTPVDLAPAEGSPFKRLLRWLGLAQPSDPQIGPGKRFLAWWGLNGPSLGAIIACGLLFGIVHVGAKPIEFLTSFPGGMALGYLTYRSRSIWPGWLIHIAQMVLVTLAMWLMGSAQTGG